MNTQQPAESPPQRFSFKFFLLFLLMLLVLGVLGGSVLSQHHHIQTLTEQLNALDAQLSKNQIESETLTQLKTQQQHLESQLQALAQQQSAQSQWLLADVNHLLTIANRRLMLAHDIEGALAALRSAAAQLKQLKTAHLTTIQTQLQENINQLAAFDPPDIEQWALTLAEYSQQVDALALVHAAIPMINTQQTITPAVEATHWQEVLPLLWAQIKQLITIRYNAKVESGLLTAQQQQLINQSVRLQFQTARMALFSHHHDHFIATLASIQAQLSRYYDQNSEQVNTIQSTLKQMQAQLSQKTPVPQISEQLSRLVQQLTTEAAAP